MLILARDEPRLEGPFNYPMWRAILRECQIIADRLLRYGHSQVSTANLEEPFTELLKHSLLTLSAQEQPSSMRVVEAETWMPDT